MEPNVFGVEFIFSFHATGVYVICDIILTSDQASLSLKIKGSGRGAEDRGGSDRRFVTYKLGLNLNKRNYKEWCELQRNTNEILERQKETQRSKLACAQTSPISLMRRLFDTDSNDLVVVP